MEKKLNKKKIPGLIFKKRGGYKKGAMKINRWKEKRAETIKCLGHKRHWGFYRAFHVTIETILHKIIIPPTTSQTQKN